MLLMEPMATPPEKGACEACLRRSRLLGLLNARIEHSARDLHTLIELLQLDDGVLIEALGGRRQEELRQLNAAPLAAAQRPFASICVHRGELDAVPGMRGVLRSGVSGRPTAVSLAGEVDSLAMLVERPIVSITGARRASSYGIETASMLARKLSLCGVTVAAAFDEGIPAASHRGAMQVGRPSIAALAGGIDVCKPAWLAPLWRRLHSGSCLITHMPMGLRGRRWGARAREAMLASLSDLVIVVEAEDEPALEAAHFAMRTGKLVAGVPGRLTSPASNGPHELISLGATLLRGAEDALDLLHVADRAALQEAEAQRQAHHLPPSLRRVLERVGSGEDALAVLASGPDAAETLLALGELEARGLLRRTDRGRYVPCLDGATPRPVCATLHGER